MEEIAPRRVSSDNSTLETIELDLASAREQFGETNPYIGLLLQAKFAYLWHRFQEGQADVCIPLLESVRSMSQLLFDCSKLSLGISDTSPGSTRRVYSFCPDAFESLYRVHFEKWKTEILSYLLWLPQFDDLTSRFLYVVGKSGEWRMFSQAQPIEVSLTRRGDASTYPFHPILSYDLGLDVILAGEISFQWSAGSPEPAIVYVNNVSGHYRPEDLRASDVADITLHTLRLSPAVSLVSIANDGAHIAGPLAEKVPSLIS